MNLKITNIFLIVLMLLSTIEIANAGIVQIQSNPEGATLTENGVLLGTTPYDLDAPTYRLVTVSKPGYVPKTINFIGSSTMPRIGVVVTLDPLTTTPTTVKVISVPSGANVYEGTTYLGVTPLTVQVFSSYRTFTLSKLGYKTTEALVFATEPETIVVLPVDVISPPPTIAPTPPPYANVLITSNPTQAAIYDGATFIGTTPLTIQVLNSAPKQLSFRKEGYISLDKAIYSTPSQVLITLQLSPTPTATIQPTKTCPDGSKIPISSNCPIVKEPFSLSGWFMGIINWILHFIGVT